jgi:hypothetical protein
MINRTCASSDLSELCDLGSYVVRLRLRRILASGTPEARRNPALLHAVSRWL